MYGEGFQSPGNIAAVASFCARLELKPRMRILDIGSGLGGSAFYLADRYDACVVGLDVAPAMVELSTERARERNLSTVVFQLGDIRNHPLSADAFDLAWTRDAILYVPENGWSGGGYSTVSSPAASSSSLTSAAGVVTCRPISPPTSSSVTTTCRTLANTRTRFPRPASRSLPPRM